MSAFLKDMWLRVSSSVLFKIGLVLGFLWLIFGAYLWVTSEQTARIVGMRKVIEEVETERTRVYKLATLIQELPGSISGNEAELIQREIVQWERVLHGLQAGTKDHRPLDQISPEISQRVQDLQQQWSTKLRPVFDRALDSKAGELARYQQEYLRQTDEFVAGLDQVVQSLDRESASRLQTLYNLQISFMLASIVLMGVTLMLFRRIIRAPLKRLTRAAEQLTAGELDAPIHVHGKDELGQLAKAFSHMAATIRQKLEEMKALHATGQEIGKLGPGGLDDELRRIADRAAELLHADLAVLMVRNGSMECWMVEAASGLAFDRIRKQILLFEETPFSNQAFESERPVIVEDLSQHAEIPVRFRDEFGAKSYMAVPLMGPHECHGVLVSMNLAKQRAFSEWDIQLAQQFASYAAVAMENARLFNAVESESHALREKLQVMERSVAELTHEVKGPAGRVAEFATWIEQDYKHKIDDKGRQYLAWIKKEGRSLANLAERMLAFAGLSHKPSPIECVDVEPIVREILAFLENGWEEKHVRVTVASDMPQVACRPIHVRQVFENLIGNALKYMGTQVDPHVEIGAVETEEGVELFVRDNGIGIDPSMADRIFLPFQRLGTIDVPGAGIGLSIVKTVVDQYDGSVRVESLPGAGATFYVRLPVLHRKTTLPQKANEGVHAF